MLLAPCMYVGRLGLTAWRRKSTIIIAILLLVLIIFGVHYNVGLGINTPSDMPQKESLISANTYNGIPYIVALGEDTARKKNIANIDSNSVQFVQNGEDKNVDAKIMHTDPLPGLDSKDIQSLEQPSRDDIAKRRNDGDINGEQGSFDNYGNQAVNQMGIPYVNLDTKNPYIPVKRVVHLDLKGAPPKVSYLKRLFPLLKTLGATTLLLEYEDTFPFTGTLSDIAAHNAYTKEQILEILRGAKDNELDVIPLVQTFGHLEFALKREGFVHLREVPESPQALCPSLNQSLDFVESMINQVMELHSEVRHIHVGCDEVFQMGACSRCRRGARDPLFLHHVKSVVTRLNRKWPRVRPLIWDDMLRHVPQRDLIDSGIGEYVDPMVWVYAEDIYRFVPTHVWDKYSSVFSTAWSASAFKGAFGETEYVPNAKRHLENNLRWIEVMSEEGPKFKNGFAGIVLTGWQRYDHFAVLCELLPAAIPSLAISLTAASRGYFDASMSDTVGGVLGCPTPSPPHNRLRPPSQPMLSLNTDPHMWDKFGRCFFPGNSFFKLTYRLHVAETEVKEFLDQTNRLKGWMTPYNIRHNYSAPLRISELTSDLPRLQRGLSSLARAAVDALSDVCDIYTISEWVEQRIYPDILALEKVQIDSQALLNRKTWERRPLPPLDDLRRFGVVMPDSERH